MFGQEGLRGKLPLASTVNMAFGDVTSTVDRGLIPPGRGLRELSRPLPPPREASVVATRDCCGGFQRHSGCLTRIQEVPGPAAKPRRRRRASPASAAIGQWSPPAGGPAPHRPSCQGPVTEAFLLGCHGPAVWGDA